MRVHRFEIAILVQDLITPPDTERADDDVNGFARRLAQAAQGPIKPGRFDGRLIVQQRFNLEDAKRGFDLRGVRLIARALQTFKQDQIADDDVVRRGNRPQFRDRRTGLIAKMRNPDRAIDNDHEARAPLSRRIVSRSPSHPMPAVDRMASRRRF